MANGEIEKPVRSDWIWANPWLWSISGLALCAIGFIMVRTLGETLEGARALLVFLGVFAASIGVTIRLSSARPAVLDQMAPPARNLLLRGMAVLFALVAVAVSALLALRFLEVNPAGLRLNSLVILWIIAGPISVAAAVACARRAGHARTRGTALLSRPDGSGEPSYKVTPAEESAAVLLLAALTCFCACWALYIPPSPSAWGLYTADTARQWDSMRLFLAVVFVVALVAAPLVVASQAWRRALVSLLLLLHFGGMAAAALSPTPSPQIVNQIWGRIYQPYLEFMYLNNAYHFYAPEPGPASFLWFRLYYKDSEGKDYARWLKIPDLDERGWHKNTVALEYQRMLAVTENVIATDPAPAMQNGDWYVRRSMHSSRDNRLGLAELSPDAFVVPFHPNIPHVAQYLKPNWASQYLLKSYAKHVCRDPHPNRPELKIDSVKIYRVVHAIPDIAPFVNENLDPRDPVNYRPYYMGKYDPDGNLLDATRYENGKLVYGDPFLYWLLPMWRDPPDSMLRSPIRSWIAKHADDPDWIYTFDEIEKRHLLNEERKNLRGR